MLRIPSAVAVSFLALSLSAAPVAASPWPASPTGTNIGFGLGSCTWLNGATIPTPPAFEPSG